jgi:predicted deacylase
LGILEPVAIPVIVVRGRRPGPTLLVTAGVHGDEFEGVAAIPELCRELDPGELTGTVVGLPICNPVAFAGQSRETPGFAGGGNLARELPGDRSGGTTARLAHGLFGAITSWLGPEDLLVDLHSAGTQLRMLPLVGYRAIPGPSLRASEEAARSFGLERVWEMADMPGTLTSEAARRGIPAVGTEITGQGGLAVGDRRLYVRGLRRLLVRRGMVEGSAGDPYAGPARHALTLATSRGGVFSAAVELGAAVRAGDVVAEVRDAFGEPTETISAPVDGEVWCLRSFGSTWPGGTAAWLGVEA